MELETLLELADRARQRKKFTLSEVELVRDSIPKQFCAFPNLQLPSSVRHSSGFTISGTPVGTFVKCALLVAGQKALGKRFDGATFYESVEKDLAFSIMRSHFHNGYPKGVFCCVQCTLAVYTVLEAGAIRYFDCKELSQDVKRMIEHKEWRFSNPLNQKMLEWSLGTDHGIE